MKRTASLSSLRAYDGESSGTSTSRQAGPNFTARGLTCARSTLGNINTPPSQGLSRSGPPSNNNNFPFGPYPSTLQVLEMAVFADGIIPTELRTVVQSIVDTPMLPQFVDELRLIFATPEEIEILSELLSEENFAAFLGTPSGRLERLTASWIRWLGLAGWGASKSDDTRSMMDRIDWSSEAYSEDFSGLPYTPRFADSASALNPEAEPFPNPKGKARAEPNPYPERKDQVHTGKPQLPSPPVSKFDKFMVLPPELRERIYELALYTGQPIRPHLCDHRRDGLVKFHDDNQHSRIRPNHNAISKLLGVTLVSKQVRDESLRCFYSANTIALDQDTTTYFAHLEHLGRFHMIRHVRFSIPMRQELRAAETLRQMNKHINDVEAYERANPMPGYGGQLRSHLVNHPRYIAGGHNILNLFICLRMLVSSFPANTDGYVFKFVLPVPAAGIFTEYRSLRWFPSVCHGLGIHLHYLAGHALSYSENGVIGMNWHRLYQKLEQRGEDLDVDVMERTLEMFPEAEDWGYWNRTAYMRVNCDGDRYEWFHVMH